MNTFVGCIYMPASDRSRIEKIKIVLFIVRINIK